MHRLVCWAIISCNKLWEENRTRHRLWLSFLPITDINNAHVTPNFHDPWLHHPISELGTWNGALMRLSRGNLPHLLFPNISFSFASHFWFKAMTCLIWPPEIWWVDVRRQNWTVAWCSAGKNLHTPQPFSRRKWKPTQSRRIHAKESNHFSMLGLSKHPVASPFATRVRWVKTAFYLLQSIYTVECRSQGHPERCFQTSDCTKNKL